MPAATDAMELETPMALTDTDRRRFFLATAVTLLALPALWWANQAENSTAPNVAVAGADVGVDIGADHDGPVGARSADTSTDTTESGTTAPTDVSVNSAASTSAARAPTTTADPDIADAPLGANAPVFLDGPSGQVGAGLAEIAVPTRPAVAHITTTATYRSNIGTSLCYVPGVVNGRNVTIVNLDNGHSISCVTVLPEGRDQVILDTKAFATLADVTDAPIPVEIRQ